MAIEDHYKPQGPSDQVPKDLVAIAVALADKLDMLVGFWAIDEKPTGSKDPLALRRAALGIIRILLENGIRLDLQTPIRNAYHKVISTLVRSGQLLHPLRGSKIGYDENPKLRDELFLVPLEIDDEENISEIVEYIDQNWGYLAPTGKSNSVIDWTDDVSEQPSTNEHSTSLLSFFRDRLKVYLRDSGRAARSD